MDEAKTTSACPIITGWRGKGMVFCYGFNRGLKNCIFFLFFFIHILILFNSRLMLGAQMEKFCK